MFFVILANKNFACSSDFFVAQSVIQFVESKQTDMLTEVDRMRLGAQLSRALSEFSIFFLYIFFLCVCREIPVSPSEDDSFGRDLTYWNEYLKNSYFFSVHFLVLTIKQTELFSVCI